MTNPGLGAIAAQAGESALRLRSAAEQTRSAWDDDARQAFDRSHFMSIEGHARAVVSALTNIAAQVDAAMNQLGAE